MADSGALISAYQTKKAGLEVINPATGSAITSVNAYSSDDALRAVEAAHAAFPEWSSRTAKERAQILKAWADLLMHHQNDLAELITSESGKPTPEALGEVAYGASYLEWFAEEARRAYGEVIPAHVNGKRLLALRQPVGVAAAITPWNFPLAMIARKAGPALAAGCPMLVKPAEATPLTALALESLGHAAGIPRDVFRVLPAFNPAPIGKVFCEHPMVRKLSFTGSTSVGKLLLEQSAKNVQRVSLELGGNAPFIVFEDANLEDAVAGAMASKYRNAGQTCVCANRFLVQRGIYDEFLGALSERVSGLALGDGAAEGVDIGPLIEPRAVEKVHRLVKDAVQKGATILTGGSPDPMGANFFAPTVLRDVPPTADIFNAEIFGPVASITPFDSEADAIRLANGTPYGLAAYFYTQDHRRIWRVTEALEFGMVGVNDGVFSTEVAPFGGVKESGLGREGGRQGLDEYLEVKYASIGGLGHE